MEDHTNDTHNESVVGGLSFENNLTYTISNKIIVTLRGWSNIIISPLFYNPMKWMYLVWWKLQ